jgi:hypothetical protein
VRPPGPQVDCRIQMDPCETHARTGSAGGARMTSRWHRAGRGGGGGHGPQRGGRRARPAGDRRPRRRGPRRPASFEELCARLWAAIPGATSATELRRRWADERVWAFEQLETLGRALLRLRRHGRAPRRAGAAPGRREPLGRGRAPHGRDRGVHRRLVATARGLAPFRPTRGGHARRSGVHAAGQGTTHRATGLETTSSP